MRCHTSCLRGRWICGQVKLFLNDLLDANDGQAGAEVPSASSRPSPLRVLLELPIVALRCLFRRADWSALHGKDLHGCKSSCTPLKLRLEDMKAAKNSTSATINDVVGTVLAGGLSRYFTAIGCEVPRHVRVAMPVFVGRRGSTRMGNDFGIAFAALPTSAGLTPFERLKLVQQSFASVKASAEPMALYALGLIVTMLLPRALAKLLLDFVANKASIVFSNVRGPTQPCSLASKPVTAVHFLVPQRGKIGIGVSVFSLGSRDCVFVGITADSALIPDPQMLLQRMDDEWQALLSEACPSICRAL